MFEFIIISALLLASIFFAIRIIMLNNVIARLIANSKKEGLRKV